MSTTLIETDPAHDTGHAARLDALIGRQAVYTSFEGERMLGTIEGHDGWHARVVFPSGAWARLNDIIEVVDEPDITRPINLDDECAVCGSSYITGSWSAHWAGPMSTTLVAWGCGPQHSAAIEAARTSTGRLTRAAVGRLDDRASATVCPIHGAGCEAWA